MRKILLFIIFVLSLSALIIGCLAYTHIRKDLSLAIKEVGSLREYYVPAGPLAAPLRNQPRTMLYLTSAAVKRALMQAWWNSIDINRLIGAGLVDEEAIASGRAVIQYILRKVGVGVELAQRYDRNFGAHMPVHADLWGHRGRYTGGAETMYLGDLQRDIYRNERELLGFLNGFLFEALWRDELRLGEGALDAHWITADSWQQMEPAFRTAYTNHYWGQMYNFGHNPHGTAAGLRRSLNLLAVDGGRLGRDQLFDPGHVYAGEVPNMSTEMVNAWNQINVWMEQLVPDGPGDADVEGASDFQCGGSGAAPGKCLRGARPWY